MNTLQETKRWFETAIPNPSPEMLNIQLGVHFEEIAEMCCTIRGTTFQTDNFIRDLFRAAYQMANHLKKGGGAVIITDRVEFLDSIADQIVTATGSGHMAHMDVVGGLDEVNSSNFSKFEDGAPVFDAHGKITKGANYVRADLNKFV